MKPSYGSRQVVDSVGAAMAWAQRAPRPRTRDRLVVRLRRGALTLLAIAAVAVFWTPVAQAINPQPIQIFLLTLPEDQVRTSLYTISTATGTTMRSVTGLSITADNTLIYYDEWENGYELDIVNPTQPNTKIWGDGNAANGCPPNKNGAALTCTNGNDVLNGGDVITLDNNVTLPRNPATVLYDGRDKVGATRAIAVTRSLWGTAPGSVLADAIEVFDTTRWGASFRIPIGPNVTDSSSMFEHTALFVMASVDNTQLTIDQDGNGTTDITTTINQGQSYYLAGGILANGKIDASQPVQVNLITGDIGSSYESRWFTVPPSVQWGSKYHAPVGTSSVTYPANVFVYNPDQATALTVTHQTAAGTGAFVVPAKGVYRFAMPLNSGAYFYAGDGRPFLAVGAMDSTTNGANNQTFDWGYTLVPDEWLTTAFALGWAPGTGGGCTSGTCNGSPVWVTPVNATTIYVKYDGNVSTGPNTAPNGLKYDVAYAVSAFESKRIFDPDKDQTGMRVFTADGVLITGAWGEDPTAASAGNPYLDVGYAIPPLPEIVAQKDYADLDGDGIVEPGDTLAYTITVRNTGAVALFSGTVVSDTVPLNTTYVPNSTVLYNPTNPGGVPVPDNGVTAFPLDEGGLEVGTLLVGNEADVSFQVTTSVAATYTEIVNQATVVTLGGVLSPTLSVPVQQPDVVQCVLNFTNGSGAPVAFYLQNGAITVQVTDTNQLTDTVTAQVKVVTADDSGDYETVTLTEIAPGVFRGSLPASTTVGQAPNDGTLYAQGGDTIQAIFTDAIYAPCDDTALITVPTATKTLYLSDAAQYLDRVDPVATGATTTLSTTVLGGSSSGSVTVVGAATTGKANSTASLSFSHTIGSGANRLMLVGISFECSGATCGSSATPTISAVNFAGNALTRVGGAFANGNDTQVDIWRLFNPPANLTGNVTVTLSAATPVVAGAITFAGADQSQSLTFTGANGNGGTLQVTSIPSAAGELIFSTVSWDGTLTVANISTSGTTQWRVRTDANDGANAGQTGAAGTKTAVSASETMTATPSTGDWAIGAVSIEPASTSGTASTVFTQTPSMASDFFMPAGGQITVTTFISSTSGAPVAPLDITATLRYNGVAFATLGSPALTGPDGNGVYKLVWTGTVAANTTIAAGQAVSLTVTTTEPGLSFRILYDSAAYPSRIDLPTTTVIKAGPVEIYSAPYPGGAKLTGATNGETVYVRTTVTDPFGYTDITTVTLEIVDPNGAAQTVALNPPYRVITTAASATFDYPWVTSVAVGNYTVTVTADEGYEGLIRDSASTPFNLSFQDLGTPCAFTFLDATGVVTTSYDANAPLVLRCSDLNRNTSITTTQEVTMTVVASSGDQEIVTLTETGADTGVFTATLPSSTTGGTTSGDGTLHAPIGSTVTATYVDSTDATDICTGVATIRSAAPALGLAKTLVQPASGIAAISETVRFDIIVSNPGPTNLVTVPVTDTFPAACLAFQSASVTPSGSAASQLTWNNIGPIDPGGAKTISVFFQVVGSCNPATNLVSASAIDQNSLPVAAGPVQADVLTTQPQLAISKTLIDPPAGVAGLGETVAFSVVITNTGSTTVTLLPLVDDYSAACIEYVDSLPPADGAGGGVALWNSLGPLTPTLTTSVVVTFQVTGPCAPAVNVAAVNGAADSFGTPVPPVADNAIVTTTISPPELTLAKSLVAPASRTATVGDAITYTVRITNTGENAITQLVITDTYDAACMALTSATGFTPTHTSAGQLRWDTLIPPQPPLLPGQELTLTLTFSATAVDPACMNTATVSGVDQFGQTVNPPQSQAPVAIINQADLSLTKSIDDATPDVGSDAVFTVVISNSGPSAATGVAVSDTLPSGYTYVGSSASAGSYNGSSLWTVGNLANGASATLRITATVNASGVYTNNAQVATANEFDPDSTPGNNSTTEDDDDSVTPAPVPVADLELDKSIDDATPDVGSDVVFTIVISNSGPSAATGVTVSDTLPSGYTFVGSSASAGTYSSGTGLWTIGDLANGASESLTITATVNASGVYTNYAQVATANEFDPDSTPGDSSTTEDDDDSVTPAPRPIADLGIDKSSAPNPHVAGQAITYTIVVTNAGPSAVSAITVTDNLPAGLTGLTYTPSAGSYNSGDGAWTGLSLAAGGRITLTIVATVDAAQRGDLTNTATVGTPVADDPNPGNNSDPDVNPQALGVVEGTIYLDNNGNGIFDAGDAPMPNVTVTITDSQGFTYTVSTNGAGYYSQTVPAGAVTVLADEADPQFLANSGLTVFNPAANGDSENPGSVTVPINGVGVENAGYLPRPGLAIDKTGLAGPVTIGDILTYTIQVTNTGNITLTGVTVSDPKLGLNQTVGVLGIGASATVTGSYGPVAETDLLTTPIVNVAAVTATTPFSTGTPVGPVTDTHSVPVISPPNLVITKDDGRTTVNPGEIVTYTIAVNNSGDITATGVVVTDVLPALMTYLTDTVGSVPTVTPPATYVWNLPDLAPGAGFTFTLSAQVAISLPNGLTNLENYVQVRSATPDRDITNNEDNDIDQVSAQPDLTLFKDAAVASSPVSNSVTITYVLSGGNIGAAIATSVTITDNLDSLVSYDSGSAVLSVNGQTPSAPSVSGSDPLIFGLPNLAPGDTYVLTYTVTVTDSIPAGTTAIANAAVVGSAEVDRDPSNNFDETALPTQPGVDLYIEKTATPASVQPGDLIQYTLTHGNLGSTTAFTATVEDQLPANTTFVAATPGYTPASPTSTVTWPVAPVAPGATGVLTLTVQVDNPLPAGVTQIFNTTVITTPEDDTVPGDNTDSTTTPVTGAPDLVVVKDDGLTEVAAGATVTYTLVYSNVGNRGASGVVITDTLLANLTFVSATPAPSGNLATGVYTWAIGALPVDGPHAITVVAQVNDTANAGELAANRVVIADDGSNGPDPDPSNNSSTDSDVVVRPYMVIEKQVEGPAYVGGVITYTINYINMGNTVARNVVISDVIPANTTLVTGSITPTAVVTGDVITWFVADSLAVGESGVLRFAVQVDTGAGGDLITAPSLSIDAAAASTTVTSTVLALSHPDCAFDDKCASLVGVWQGPDPVGPADWNSNPRLLAFDDSTWLPPLAAITETYWTAPTNLLAEWVAITTTAQFDPNYTFYRQSFCMPLNAHGFDATLLQANDDIGDIYLNGVYLGQKIGSGAAASFDATPGLQSGINILATRVLNNNHGGHGPSGADQSGLIFNLSAGYDHVHPFLAAPKVVLAGQPLTFTVDKQALGGRQPYSYTLDFGEGSPVDYQLGESFAHTYAAPGVYTATVTARAQYGCTGSDQVVVTVLPADSNMLANRATVGYANDSGIAYDGETGAGIPITPPDLTVVKSDDPDPVAAGANLLYTLAVTNSDAIAHNVVLTDVLPSEVSFLSSTAGCTESSGVVTCSLGDLAIGATRAITVLVAVGPGASGTITNSVAVAGDEVDPTPANNSDTEPTTLNQIADLELDKRIDDTTPDVGSDVVFTVVVTNSGPSDATGVAVSDTLPSGYTLVDSSASAGSYSGGLWTIGDLPSGASESLRITATVNASGDYANYAQVATSNEFDPDSTPGDDSTTQDDDDSVTPAPRPVADLSLDKSIDDTTPDVGSDVVFTVAIINSGPSDATGVAVSDTLPNGYTYVGASATQGSYNGSNLWTVGNLANGASASLTLTATVNASGVYTNYAQVATSNEFDPDSTPGDDSTTQDDDDSVTPAPMPVADLGIDKSSAPNPHISGQAITYTIVVTNAGPSAVSAITVTDNLPASISGAVYDESAGSYNSATGAWTGLSLAAGGRITLTIVATVDADQRGDLTNTATVATPDADDPNPGNNSDPDTNPQLLATVTGVVFEDVNGNGVKDAGEGTAPGATVTLTDSQGFTQTVTPDANGLYTATLPTGPATVDVTVPPPYQQTVGTDPDTITVNPGANDAGIDGYVRPALIGGAVYDDLNGDGAQDSGEPGVPGVVVTLSNGVTTTTDATGAYAFTVNPGTYTVAESTPAGYISTGTEPGTVGSTVVDDDTIAVTVLSNQNSLENDFLDALPATIAGAVYDDLNGDGAFDAGDTGIPGVLVTLSNGMTTTTDATGAYTFTVTPGVYTITESTPAGYYSTADTDGANDDTIVVTVISGSGSTGNNFLDARPGLVEGVVYEDTNGNGTQDAGEPGIPGVAVLVTDSAGATYTLTTDANGQYSQTVPAGDAEIAIDETTLPAGLTQTEGTNPTTVNVPSGGSASDVDGYQPPVGLVEGVVYEDSNGNGMQDAGEPGIPGVAVLVTDSAGVTYTLTTDANGQYSQTVPAGDAEIAIDETTLPAGLTQTEGTNPTTVNVPSGGSASDVDGYQPPVGLVEGVVYEDTNGNGQQDAGEPGISGVAVLVTDSAGVTYTLTTDANGQYSQTVPAGPTDIAIDETTLPAGLTQTEGTNPTTVNVPSGGSASDVDGYQPIADLSLDKSVDNATPAVGQNVVFTLLASNGGPSAATGVTVSDNLPSGYTFVGASATQGSYSSGTGVWTIGGLANGASATLRITATVNASGVYTNYAQIATSDQPDPDSTPGDNSTTQDDDATQPVNPTPVADLSLDKSVDDATPAVGQNVVFTLLASNAGPSDATGVTVSDNLPSGYTFVASSATQGSYSNGTGIWTIGALANGASATLRITATVNASGVYTNYAQIATSDQPDPDSTPGDNSTTQDDDATQPVNPTPVADLELDKSVDNATPAVGQNVVFTLLASNGGPSAATGVTVSDNLPSGYTFVGASATQGSYSSGTGVWTIGGLANGAGATLRITATVNASGVYTNYAQVATSDQPDPDSTPGDNSTTQDDDATQPVNPTPVADLSLDKSVDDTTPAVGQNVVFTLLASNAGPSGATGVTVSDNLPSGYTFVGASTTQGSYNSGLWTVGGLANGASATLRITATVNASGVYTNYAQIATSDQPDPDSTPGDNSTTQDDDATQPVSPTPVADLSLDKSVDNATPAVGQNVVFTLLASNGGPSAATGVTVSDNLPSGYTFVGASATQGSYSSGTGVWTIGGLANGASATLRITATVNASGVYTNYAQVATSDQPDPDSTPGDNSTTQDDDATQPVNPTPVADLSLDKSVDDATPAVGQNVVFTLLASNAGPSDATGVTVSDNLPSGYTFVASSATQGSYSNGTGIWTIGALANGASATLRITATVNASGVYTNYAQIATSDQPDPDSTPGDNSTTQDDDATQPVNPTPVADLELDKSVDNATPAVGQNVVFTLLASNGGPSAATGVTVSDNLPSGYTFVGASATQGSYSSGTGVWTIGGLANGAGATLRITATVNASGVYTNYAQVATSDQPDPDSTPGDNSTTQDDDATQPVNPTPVADLSLDKSVDDTTPAVGQNVVFTLLASNAGPSGATGVTVSDNLPSGYTFVGASTTQGSYNSGLWTVGGLANGASATLRITATVNASGVYTNYAQVATSDQPDPDSTPGDNSTTQDDDATQPVNPTPVADLSLDKSVDNATPAVGQNVVFTLLASNGGPSGATGVTVSDNLPSGYTFVGASATQGSYSSGTGLWTIGGLANGASATLRITATVNASGVYTNYAQIATSDQPDPDSTPGDNSATQDDDATQPVNPTPVADLSLDKSVDDATPAVGQNVVFTLLASNGGPSGATGVTVSDTLPSGYTFVGASATQGSYSSGTGVWTIGGLANGASATLRITATVNASGVYTNYAQVATSDQPDPDSTPGDNSATQDDDASVTPAPVAIADLNLDKSVSNTTPNIGANVVFRVLVTNAGPSDATGVTVSDPLPSGYAFVASSATVGSYSNGTGVWTIGALARNASATLSITATVRSTGVYTNYAQIATSNQSDPNSTPGNNSTTEDDDDTQPVTPIFTYDFGDLPSDGAGPLLDYPVLLADNGAQHIIVPGIRLGARVDNEADGQPSVGATGDDLTGSDDEDGVLFLTPLTPGSTATIRVTAAITGYLAGWFDWNSNGVLEQSERVFVDRLLTPGANDLNVSVPAGITPSALYSRFRFTTSQAWADLPTGLAPDGEVEDYALLSVGGTLWRDNGVGGGAANNGRLDGAEPRLANVTVQLLDSNGAVIATTTSNAQGDYIFYGVTPGNYCVRVPASQFQAGGPLAGLYSSIGAGDPNADLDQDVDENGIDNNNPAANGISTGPITLTAGGEPDAAVDGNGVNSNTTIDLSFVKYDLALRKQVASLSETPLVPGLSTVTFRIDVFNQGDVAASNVQVIDYVQNGFTFVPAQNPGWNIENGAVVTTIAGPIQPGASAAVNMVLSLNLGTRGQTLSNFAEVAADGWFAGADFDSTPDRNNSEQPVKDEVLDENAKLHPGIDDEDDHDVATLKVDVFDLALRKSLIFAPTPIAAGHSKLTFALEVFNQGSITATDVMLVDYVPSGLLFDPADNPNWVQTPSLTPTTVLTTAIGPGQSFVTTLVLRTTPSAANRTVTNAAEIAASDDQIVGNAAPIDADSTMDLNPNNEGTVKDDVIGEDGKNTPGADEDDHDIATVDLPGVGLGGQIWNDDNNNGVLDASEQGVAGVTVQLYRAGDTPGVNQPVATVTTGADGSYLFAGLNPGQYVVYIPNPPANFPASSTLTDTADNQEDGDDNGSQTNPGGPVTSPVITLTPGEEPISDIDGSDINTDTTIDFGFFSPLALGNRVWHDANDNGIFDSGETGIDGVVVQLYRADQTPGVATPLAQVTTTNGGEYRFTNLQPGEYRVYIPTPPAAYPAVSSVFDPEDNGEDNDNNGAQTTVGGPVISPNITLATGSEPTNDGDDANGDMTVDFGFRVASVSLGNLVWHDRNNNGRFDGGEAGIDGVQVQLYRAGQMPGVNAPLAVDVTSDGGIYQFINLTPGQYFVHIPQPPAAYPTSSTPTTAADNQVDNDDNGIQATTWASVTSPLITLTSGGEPTADGDDTIDFGFFVFDLALRKRVASLSSTPLTTTGNSVTYAIDVINQGDLPTSNVAVIDYIQLGLVYNPADNPTWSADANPVTIIPGPIPPGGQATVEITLRVADGLAGQTITNYAEIFSDNAPSNFDRDSTPDGVNNELPVKDGVIDENAKLNPSMDDEDDHDIATLAVQAFDLALRKRVAAQSDRFLIQGQSTVTFTIEVFNQGDQVTSNITVVDYIQPGFVYEPSANPGWSADANPTTVISGPLAPGQSTAVEIVLRVAPNTAGQRVFNVAEIAGDNMPPGSDKDSTPDAVNNDSPVKDDVIDENAKLLPGLDDEDDHDLASVEVGRFDLALRKRLAAGQSDVVKEGDNVVFTIEVFNQGDIAARNISVVDYTPPGFNFVQALNPGWDVSSGRPQNVIAGPLQPGQSRTVTLTLTVGDAAFWQVNGAEIRAAQDNQGLNRIDSDSTYDAINGNDVVVDDVIDDGGVLDEDDHDIARLFVDRVDASLFKRLADGQPVQVRIGDDVRYVIGVRNQSSIPISGVVVVDYIPAGMILSPSDTNGWTLINDGRMAMLTLPGSIPVGGVVNVEIVLRVVAALNPEAVNRAEIVVIRDENGNVLPDADSTPDTNPDNDTDGSGDTEDDTDSVIISVTPPTVIVLDTFALAYQNPGMLIWWTTSLELDTFGFHLYRNTSNNLTTAERVTAQLIPGKGTNGGDYSFFDPTVKPGRIYWYWLVELEVTGKTNVYGPVRSSTIQGYDPLDGANRVFLPLIDR